MWGRRFRLLASAARPQPSGRRKRLPHIDRQFTASASCAAVYGFPEIPPDLSLKLLIERFLATHPKPNPVRRSGCYG